MVVLVFFYPVRNSDLMNWNTKAICDMAILFSRVCLPSRVLQTHNTYLITAQQQKNHTHTNKKEITYKLYTFSMIAIQCALRSLAWHTETEWSTRNNRNKYRRAPPKLVNNLIHLRLTRFGRPQFVNEELLNCRKVAIRGRGPFIWV